MPDSPIVVSALAAAGNLGHISLTWSVDDPNANGPSYVRLDTVEIHAASVNNRASATKIAEGDIAALHLGVVRAAVWYYWARARDTSGRFGDWFPSSATGGVVGTELIGTLSVPAASGLVASGGINLSALSWALTDPNANGLGDLALDVVELHAASGNDRSLATKVAEGKTSAIHHGIAAGATRYYWIRPRHVNGTFGAWHPVSSTAGVSATELSGDRTLSDPGYWKMPNGIVFQWGTESVTGSDTVTFPTTFSTLCFAVPIAVKGTTPHDAFVNVVSTGTASFDVVAKEAGGTDITVSIDYIAVGF